jgi:hypothetical protein
MQSFKLILLAGLVVMTPVQARAAPKPVGPPASHFKGACEPDADGKKFAAKVCYTRYNPGDFYDEAGRAAPNKPYESPACDDSKQVTDDQRAILARAYSLAPSYVKARLCRLTKFFLREASKLDHESWGYWEPPDLSPKGGVFIALSDRYVAPDASLVNRRNEVLQALLPQETEMPTFVASGSSDPAMAALGVIAHELGHVLLADTNADGVHPRHPRRDVSGPPRSRCFESDFVSRSWDPNIFHRNMRRWVFFGDRRGNKAKNVDLTSARTASDKVQAVYRSGHFVGYFASISPEEDFVETYAHKVIVDVQPTLTIQFPRDGRTMNVLDFVKRPVPTRKIACLRRLGLFSARP